MSPQYDCKLFKGKKHGFAHFIDFSSTPEKKPNIVFCPQQQ